MDAKTLWRIGKRISSSMFNSKGLNTDGSEHLEVIKDDMYNNIQRALDQDGSTGKLSTPDGLLRGRPQIVRGFFLQVFGYVRYSSDLDVFGKLYWYGFASKEIEIKGKKQKIRFETDQVQKLGFDSERDASQWLIKMIDAYYGQRSN